MATDGDRLVGFDPGPIGDEVLECLAPGPMVGPPAWADPMAADAPAPFELPPEEVTVDLPDEAPSGPAMRAVDPSGPRSEWPSARTIFAAQGARPAGLVATPPRSSRRRRAEPSPSDVLAPPTWTIPGWLGLVPASAMALVVGLGGIFLAYQWTLDGMSAGLALRLALRDEKSAAPSIDPSIVPRGGWWRSTAPHRAAWAVALTRASEGEDHAEDVRAMADAARHASPLSSSTRFAVEPKPPAEGEPGGDLAHLGRSRDVVSLTWAGRRLRRDGKAGEALRAYRSALAIAARAGRDELDDPAFDEDVQVRRYRLPRESLMGAVLLDMIRAGDWTHEQWAEALPEGATGPFFAAKALQKAKDRVEADRLAGLAIERAEADLPAGLDPGEHRAAVAEALIASGRWADAAAQYRRAVERAGDDLTRRRWWLNLAEVAQRMNDDALRAQSVESAKVTDSRDEITRRALRYQQGGPGLAARGDRP